MSTVWRLSYDSTYAGVTVVNTFHIVSDPTLGADDRTADQVRDDLHAALTTKYRGVLTSAMTLNSLTVRQELAPGDTSIPAESVQTIGLAGTRVPADTLLPASMTLLATLRTNAAVRSGHGRLFMPPPVGSAALGGVGVWNFSNAYATSCSTFLTELIATHAWTVLGVPAGNYRPVVYSRTRRARGDASYWFGVTAFVMRTAPHWLRSRSTAP